MAKREGLVGVVVVMGAATLEVAVVVVMRAATLEVAVVVVMGAATLEETAGMVAVTGQSVVKMVVAVPSTLKWSRTHP